MCFVTIVRKKKSVTQFLVPMCCDCYIDSAVVFKSTEDSPQGYISWTIEAVKEKSGHFQIHKSFHVYEVNINIQ